MKKLALIKKDFHLSGGLEKVTYLLLNAFLKKPLDVSCLTSSSLPLPCKTHSYQSKKWFKRGELLDFDRWTEAQLKQHPADIVLSMDRSSSQTHHRAGNGVHAAYLRLRAQREGWLKKLSFSMNPTHQLHLKLEKLTFESPKTEAIIVNSALVQRQILEHYNTPSSKIHVIHNGVEWQEFETPFHQSIRDRSHYIRKLQLEPLDFHFLFVGHNFHRKGLKPLLHALALLENQDVHLSVVGSDKQLFLYQAALRRLGLEKKVTFFGPQPTATPFYLAADAVVIPSIYDPFANVTVEALALGLFVVSSKMNGGHEVLQSHSGIIVENPYDLEELVSALQEALKHPKEPLKALQIRNSVAHLDYSIQLEKICQRVLA